MILGQLVSNLREQYWITEFGKKIAVGELSLEHLQNILRLLIRKDRILPPDTTCDDMGVGHSPWDDKHWHDQDKTE